MEEWKRKRENNMNELMKIETNEIANKELKKSFSEINKAVSTIGRNTWKVADEIAKIVNYELYKEDFENLHELSKVVGMSASNISRMSRVSVLKNKYYEKLEKFSVSCVSEMLTVAEKVDENSFITFLNFLLREDISTVAGIRKYAKNFLEVEETEETEEVETEEVETEETEEVETEETEEEIYDVEFDGATYQILASVKQTILKILVSNDLRK